jgi:hypothetical protein
VAPGRALATLRGLADEDRTEVHAVAVGFRDEVRAATNGTAEGDKELNQESDRVCLGLGLDGADKSARETMERTGIERGWPRVHGRFVRWNRAAHP